MKTYLAARYALLALAALIQVLAGNAFGQAFPSKGITVVTPFPPSVVFQAVLRQMAEQLQAKTGRAIVFDAAPGSNGILAAVKVKRAEPDGHTIGLTYASPLTLDPLLAKDPPYDSLKDFTYITMLTRHGILVVAGKQFGPNNLTELIALAKAKPDTVRFGYAATGARVDMLRLAAAAGIKLFEVPYSTQSQVEIATLAGDVDVLSATVGSGLPQIKAGQAKPLFIGSANRSQQLPDVASVSETFPNVRMTSWFALHAPAGVPADRIEWHRREWIAQLKDPKITERMQSFGYDIVASTPQELLDQVKRELSDNAPIVKQYNLGQ